VVGKLFFFSRANQVGSLFYMHVTVWGLISAMMMAMSLDRRLLVVNKCTTSSVVLIFIVYKCCCKELKDHLPLTCFSDM
jgi:hypothetical protein